jgi:hypothetical protein
MDEIRPEPDTSREDVVIFLAEGIVCERLDVSIDGAVVALADMAVTRGVSLVEMARCIVVGEIDPGSDTEARRPTEEEMADPESG